MLFGTAFQQSKPHQPIVDQSATDRSPMLVAQASALNGTDCRGRRINSHVRMGYRGLGFASDGRNGETTTNAMDLRAMQTAGCNHDESGECYLHNEGYPNSKNFESKTVEAGNANITTVENPSATAIRCTISKSKTWHIVPFIHNPNRLTCRWEQPSI